MATLPTRKIGPFDVSTIGLGCMNLSHAYDVFPSEEQGAAVLNKALDLGCTLIDSAALYGEGANERLIAKAIGHRRSEYTLATKCVLDLVDGKRVLDGRPETIKGSCERSLKKLNVDVIDLYYLHRIDRNVPIEDSVGALKDLVDAGKVRAIGLSEMGADTIRRAHAVHPVSAVQSEYCPTVRNVEVAVLDTCVELGIAFVAFSPVGRGMLAGSIKSDTYAPGDIRLAMPRFREPQLSENLKLVDRFEAVARKAGIAPAQLALLWVLAQRPNIIAIPGTRSLDHLAENMAAATMTIDPAILAEVDEIFPVNSLKGSRYTAALQSQIDTELLPNEEVA